MNNERINYKDQKVVEAVNKIFKSPESQYRLNDLDKLIPEKTFNYSEGRGVIVSHNLVYISSECCEGFYETKIEAEVENDRLKGGILNVIFRTDLSQEEFTELVDFANLIQNRCIELRD